MKLKNIVKKMEGLKKKRKILVDISVGKAVILQVEVSGTSLEIKKEIVMNDLDSFFNEGIPVNIPGLVKEIIKEIKNNDIKDKVINISYESQLLQMKLIKLVELNEKDLEEFVELEYQRQFSSRSKMNYVMDYQVVGKHGDDKDISSIVMLASVPKSEVSELIREFKNKKYKVECIDSNINVLRNLMVLENSYDINKIHIHLGKHMTYFLCVVGNALIFTREFSFSYLEVVKSLNKEIKLSNEEIKDLIFKVGLNREKLENHFSNRGDIENFEETIEVVLKNFISELFKSITFVKDTYKIEPEKITVSGYMSEFIGLEKFIEDNTRLYVKKWEYKEGSLGESIKLKIDKKCNIGNDHIKALGLALRGLV